MEPKPTNRYTLYDRGRKLWLSTVPGQPWHYQRSAAKFAPVPELLEIRANVDDGGAVYVIALAVTWLVIGNDAGTWKISNKPVQHACTCCTGEKPGLYPAMLHVRGDGDMKHILCNGCLETITRAASYWVLKGENWKPAPGRMKGTAIHHHTLLEFFENWAGVPWLD